MADESAMLDVVERVSKSVVNVNTVRLLQDSFYQVVPVKGIGSGVIIDASGYVITNRHVIEGARRIDVTLASGEVLAGRMAGACGSDDIAIIKVSGKNLPAAELGDSDALRVGQTVFAMGNPLGLIGGPTVTRGVISSVKRSIRSDEGVLEDLVQTDAAINPGNSGGPLVDTEGRVIAINTAIVPFAQGIGFAIPVNTAKRCATDIIAHGVVVRPYLGVSGLSVTPEIAEYYKLHAERGALVADVMRNSPASKAGLERGDIIIAFGEKAIGGIDELVRCVSKCKAGERVRLTVVRGVEKYAVNATLEKTP